VTGDAAATLDTLSEPAARRVGPWWWAVLGITAAALAVRVAYILVWMDPSPLGGDAPYYHLGANLLATGYGFVQPSFFALSMGAVRQPGAAHPPAYLVFLTGPSLLGLRTPLDHQIWSALLGSGMTVVMALLGRELGGRRAGLLAAGVAAVYPNFWLLDGLIQAESLLVFSVALATLLAYRLLHRPRTATAVGLGAVTESPPHPRRATPAPSPARLPAPTSPARQPGLAGRGLGAVRGVGWRSSPPVDLQQTRFE